MGESKQRAHVISELVRDTLTSYMVMGVMDKRDSFLNSIRGLPGVKEIRVVKGEAVVKQYGYRWRWELPLDEVDKLVLRSGKPYTVLKEGISEVSYRIVIPYKAEPIKGVDCLSCHRVKPGETLGAISLTMDLSPVRNESAKLLALLTIVFLIALSNI